MAIKFNSILGILLVVVATVLLYVSEVQGGRKIVINGDDWVDIPNVQDPKIVEVGRFAIHEINKEAKTELVFLKVIAGQSQIKSTEATINFKLLISALDRDSPHYYQVMVSDKERGKSRNLTSFKECTKFDKDIYMCRQSGIWASEVYDEGYKSDEIVVGQSVSFMNLKATNTAELEIDECIKVDDDTLFTLREKYVTIGDFSITISCAHTIIVVKSKSITKIHSYCFDYYKPPALANTYEISMGSMLDKDDWSVPGFVLEEIVLPPRYKKMPGRPRKRRGKPNQKISTNTNCCERHGQNGHN
ncbi:hypothetical protein H5410_020494 [Solanum commersonii]|uniref:Cystatin domain-containing protein n=1 Tax=Solanum commersonii TaxID=4109 RepID=A0A9J5ZA58_SOLCO|nr:hypothetical protein H5410_020494 [Solanum commersonii]